MGKDARIQVRIPSELKVQLEQQAIKENMDFSAWLRMKLPELQARYPGQISVVDTVNLPMPMQQLPYYHGQPSYGQPSYGQPSYAQQPYYQPYPYYQTPPPPSQMDRFLDEMIKMAQVKMLQDLIKGGTDSEEFIRAWRNQGMTSTEKDGGWNWEKYQQMQMLQNQQDREMARIQQQMMNAERQLELARSRGDKPGENKALEMITALMTAQGNQGQNFIQQMMALQATQSQNQQNLFTAAMQGNKESDAKFQTLQNQMWQSQNVLTGQLWQMHVDNLSNEMERIKNTKNKDTLAQLKELIDLRESSPVYKAAFDAAFGVKEESTIGKILPQLKEWGVDKFVEKMGSALTNMIAKPPSAAIPPPTPLPPPESLEKLQLPKAGTSPPPSTPSPLPYPIRTVPMNPQPSTQPSTPPEPEIPMGYTNLNRPETHEVIPLPEEEVVTIEKPETEETTEASEAPTEKVKSKKKAKK